MRDIYQRLDIPGFDQAEAPMREFLGERSEHNVSRYELPRRRSSARSSSGSSPISTASAIATRSRLRSPAAREVAGARARAVLTELVAPLGQSRLARWAQRSDRPHPFPASESTCENRFRGGNGCWPKLQMKYGWNGSIWSLDAIYPRHLEWPEPGSRGRWQGWSPSLARLLTDRRSPAASSRCITSRLSTSALSASAATRR